MKKDSKILITGTTGFVGNYLLQKMLLDGYTIEKFTHKQLDLLDTIAVDKMIEKIRPEYIINCAAIAGGIKANMENPYKFLYENLVIQNNIINLAIKYGVKKVLFLGSSCVYPEKFQPMQEENLLMAKPEITNEGYAISKIAGIKLCQYSNRQFDTKFVVLMPCNLYGPGDDFDLNNSHVVSALIRKIYNAKINNQKEVIIWGSGKPERELLYIDDCIDAIIWSMKNLRQMDILNVGTGKTISIKELAYLIKKIIGYNGEFKFDGSKPDGMMLKQMDVSKINKLGWKALTSLKEGIKKTVQYYKTIIEKDLKG